MTIDLRTAVVMGLLALSAHGTAAAAKDESRILPEAQLAQQTPPSDPIPLPAAGKGSAQAGTVAPAGGTAPDAGAGDGATEPDITSPDANPPAAGTDQGSSPDDMSLGEIPDIATMELTVDIAKRAIDAYSLVKTKYGNTDLEQYDNLQDFVDQNDQGKEFEADIKKAGFANVNDWNLAVTTLGFAYSGVTNDPTADIKQQIAEIQADTKIAQDMKDRMIKSLNAMLPSDNNRKVVQELMKDAAYLDKLKQLNTEEE